MHELLFCGNKLMPFAFFHLHTAPIIKEIEMDLPELTVNGNVTTDATITVDLPHISDENGPFR